MYTTAQGITMRVDILYPLIPFSPQPIPKVVAPQTYAEKGCRSHMQRVGTKLAV